MGIKRKSNKRKNRKTRRKQSVVQDVVAATTIGKSKPQAGNQSSEEGESWYSSEWQDSRSGARASRGFHFQDAVGAWFASRLASRNLAMDSLTPEGFDDIQLDGPKPIQVEVKSRQGRLGRFPVATAAKHIVDAWVPPCRSIRYQ